MEEAAFWALIGECRVAGGMDSEQVARLLWRRLRGLTVEEIDGFIQHWNTQRTRTYVWPVQEAANLMFGRDHVRDLYQVQDWIVSHGREVTDRILEDADRLVELVPDRHNVFVDWFSELAIDAYVVVSDGRHPEFGLSWPDELQGEPVDFSDPAVVAARYPRLCAYRRDNTWIAEL